MIIDQKRVLIVHVGCDGDFPCPPQMTEFIDLEQVSAIYDSIQFDNV